MPDDPFAAMLRPLLRARERQGLWRQREIRESPTGPWVRVDGQTLLSFSSNDYLGLANDPRVHEAFCAGARRYGVGAGAAHLLGGHTRVHHELEEQLADFVGSPKALLFSTGYMANLALITTLATRHTLVWEDRRNHASLLDAVRLAQAQRRRYRDLAGLRDALEGAAPGGLIATDGVFSMDGDMADIPGLIALAADHGAGVIVDDAHAFGVVGPGGRGSAAAQGLAFMPPLVHMGTLGKAFGVFGAFVAASAEVVAALIQIGRPYIYTTALPPAVAAAAQASLAIIRAEEHRRTALRQRIEEFRAGAQAVGLTVLPSCTPIQAVVMGDAHAALRASEFLRRQGLLVLAVRPPTVPVGAARLRVALSAAHSADDVARLLASLETYTKDRL